MRRLHCWPCLLLIVLLAACGGQQKKTRLVLAATTSIDDTGLLDSLAAAFGRAHPEIELSPLAVGTGQAIQLARSGDADVVLSHDSAAEMQLVTEGRARERRSVMHNDFVIAGPAADPARARGQDAIVALRAIAGAHAAFVSRADDSGTHRRELELWRQTAITPAGIWYIEAGLGMGDALLLAGQKGAYILSDRGTYLRFAPRLQLAVICEHDPRMLNRYGITVMNGARAHASAVFADWITSSAVQRMIGDFGKREFGQALFKPSAHSAVSHDTIPTGER